MHNYATSVNGSTSFASCTISNFTLSTYLPPSDPQWLDSHGLASNIVFIQLPVGWKGPPHKDPVPQLVFFMSGCGNWTTSDGTSHVFGPGDLYFGEDQLSWDGHTSANCGDTAVVLILMQFGLSLPTVNRPCWFT
jgi:hypothetical protein